MAIQLALNPVVIERKEDDCIEEEVIEKASVHRNISRPRNTVNLIVFTFKNGIFYPMQQMDIHATAGFIIQEICNRLNWFQIPDQPLNGVFSLWMVSKYLELQLKSCHQPVRLYKNWCQLLTQYTTASKEQCINDKPKLYFRRNAFLALDKEKDIVRNKISGDAIDFLYQEAVSNIMKGKYPPLVIEDAVELGGYQCAVKYSKHDIKLDSIKERLVDFLPPYMCVGKENQTRVKSCDQLKRGCGLAEDLFSVYNSCFQGDDDVAIEEIKYKYLEKCWDMSYYGCVMFQGLVERKKTDNLVNFVFYRDRTVIIAINPSSIHILNDTNKEVLLHLTLSQDLSCDFQPATEEGEHFYSSLWLEFDTSFEIFKRLQIFSRQAPLMDAMIGRCLDVLKNDTVTDARVVSCSQSTKAFVCQSFTSDPVTGNKVKLSVLSSLLKKNVKTTPTPNL